MSEQHNPAPREIGGIVMPAPRVAGHSGYNKGRSSASSARGRMYLVLIFFALRVADACIYFGSAVSDKKPLLAGLCTGALWTTVLLAGIWRRRDWCRWALMVLLLPPILYSVVSLFSAVDLAANHRSLAVLAAVAAINGGVAWAVVGLRDIGRLTSRAYGSRPYGYK